MSPSVLERVSGHAAIDRDGPIPLRFGDAAEELRAGLHSSMLVDLSALGRVHATGKDILDLLHRLSTADLRSLPPGEGRPTVLTTGKGRIVDRVFVHHLGSVGVLLVTGAGNGARIRAHIDRFTFAESTGLTDASDSFRHLGLLGPDARDVAESAGIPLPSSFGSARHEIEGRTVLVLGEDGFGGMGLSLLFASTDEGAVGPALVRPLLERNTALAGATALESWRILRGYPVAGHELTEEHNPLEAGLEEAVSFTKGCYVGQEVVARLRTYDKVSRVLVGIVLPEDTPAPEPGTVLRHAGRDAGIIRSAVIPPGRRAPVALAYVRREVARGSATVEVGTGERTARVVKLPFDPIP